MYNKTVTEAIKQAVKKGLVVKKNKFTVGWSISLPGGYYHAMSDDDMINYVKGY